MKYWIFVGFETNAFHLAKLSHTNPKEIKYKSDFERNLLGQQDLIATESKIDFIIKNQKSTRKNLFF
jgi:hypothetical protein